VLALDDTRALPANATTNGRDFVAYQTNGFSSGTIFAAIAGPGPLVGPTLAAQSATCRHALADCRPAFAGCVQILSFSFARFGATKIARPDGAREVSERGGFISQIACWRS